MSAHDDLIKSVQLDRLKGTQNWMVNLHTKIREVAITPLADPKTMALLMKIDAAATELIAYLDTRLEI